MTKTPSRPAVTPVVAPGNAGSPFVFVGLGSAVVLLVAFFLPWWGISFGSEKDFEKMGAEEVMKKGPEAASAIDESFLNKMWSEKEREEIAKNAKKDEGLTLTAFGWKFGTGLTGLIFGFLLIGAFLPGRFVPAVAKWEWAGALVAAVLGLILFILSLIVIFGTPGKNVEPFLSQGISIGPILCLLASLGTIAAGVMVALPAVKGLVKKAKSA